MAMTVYHVHVFLSNSSVSKMAENMLMMMTAWVALSRPKRIKMSKKVTNLVRSDRGLSIRVITETIGFDKE